MGIAIGEWTFGIGVTCFIFMSIFAIRDWKSYKAGKHTDYKSIIVSIGVLGTFVGIFIGLLDFNTSNIEQSVPTLLDGLKLAFGTSILGMFISIVLSGIQKSSGIEMDSELDALSNIDKKLSVLNDINASNTDIVEQIKNFRIEIKDEQAKTLRLIEDNFVKTNESLEKAIETLSKGATSEIIEALENVISDFNKNLTEQFGENFRELNEAVVLLVDWQENYKSIVEESEKLLREITNSLSQSDSTLATISERNQEIVKIHEKIAEFHKNSSSLIASLNIQVVEFSDLVSKSKDVFDEISNDFDNIRDNLNGVTDSIGESLSTQAESLERLTNEIRQQLPKSLSELEGTLTGLTVHFGEEYKRFLDAVRELMPNR